MRTHQPFLMLLLLLCACTRSKVIEAPVESCTRTLTGRTDMSTSTNYICAGYDSKGNCTVQVPNVTTTEWHEAAYDRKFTRGE